MRPSFYVTTPIYYVNDVPHIGHAYTTVACDALARYHRMLGERTWFLTGTDEHGQKIEKTAKAQGIEPIELADRVVGNFRSLWTRLGIRNDDFIRTTEERHHRSVRSIFKTCLDKGDIYLGEYEDWYCTPCESFFTEMQLVGGNCPDCGRPVEKLKEESYFFRLSKYGDALLKHIEDNPDFIYPPSRRNEIISFIKQGLRDLSVSRTSISWGIPVPTDRTRHIIYVWFDALTNYITALGYPDDTDEMRTFWPAIHVIGKDILKFHAIYWPCFLMSAGLPLPRKVVAHGWWTVEGQKMSKSLGNAIDPFALCDTYGVDAFRYFLLREVPFGLDGDFSRDAIVKRINGDLANDLGNLVQRSLSMLEKFTAGRWSADSSGIDAGVMDNASRALADYDAAMQEPAFSRALDAAWGFIGWLNKYIVENEPWKLNKDGNTERLSAVLSSLAEGIRVSAVMVTPFMPSIADAIYGALGIGGSVENAVTVTPDSRRCGALSGSFVSKPIPSLFPRIEPPKESKPVTEKTEDLANVIAIDDVMKLELRVGEIRAAEAVPKSDKLLRLTVFDGAAERTIVAGIGKQYAPDTLAGKLIVFVANLKPAKLMGIESHGMLLAASDENGLALVTPERPVAAGSRVK